MDAQIEIILNSDELAHPECLFQSDNYDYTPEDLIIYFEREYIAKAKEILKRHPELLSISFHAGISSESFEGKLGGEHILFYRHAVFAVFNNEWTGTVYEANITANIQHI